jgi:hypothetical protein
MKPGGLFIPSENIINIIMYEQEWIKVSYAVIQFELSQILVDTVLNLVVWSIKLLLFQAGRME